MLQVRSRVKLSMKRREKNNFHSTALQLPLPCPASSDRCSPAAAKICRRVREMALGRCYLEIVAGGLHADIWQGEEVREKNGGGEMAGIMPRRATFEIIIRARLTAVTDVTPQSESRILVAGMCVPEAREGVGRGAATRRGA